MISNYSYFLDKTIQTLFLTAALSIMIKNGWSSVLSIFLTVLFSLIILDGLQGKTGYVYTYPQITLSKDQSQTNQSQSTINQVTTNTGSHRQVEANHRQATIDSLAKEIQEFKNQLNVDKLKPTQPQLTGGSYYIRLQ